MHELYYYPRRRGAQDVQLWTAAMPARVLLQAARPCIRARNRRAECRKAICKSSATAQGRVERILAAA